MHEHGAASKQGGVRATTSENAFNLGLFLGAEVELHGVVSLLLDPSLPNERTLLGPTHLKRATAQQSSTNLRKIVAVVGTRAEAVGVADPAVQPAVAVHRDGVLQRARRPMTGPLVPSVEPP